MARPAVFVLAGLCVVTLLLNQVTARAMDKAELLQKVDELRQAIEEAELLPAEDEANEEVPDLPFESDTMSEMERRNMCRNNPKARKMPQCRRFRLGRR
ncbi:Hypp460 [Branchiostoma lanceolatum]|uniref:Hypp460 protein n=1 Tax=Branchiostoma lanceolatum TaxID=7740 RepID=A0A8J9YNW2_BRALA|nr:Hypp460 [Branchiostoma lanceolatum]